jgi:hypothetical protein
MNELKVLKGNYDYQKRKQGEEIYKQTKMKTLGLVLLETNV